MSTFNKVRSILMDVLGLEPEEVKPKSKVIEDFNADSLDCVEICMELEEEFQIEIPDNDVQKLKAATVASIVKYVNEHK
jgi:acyl carrier protein